MAKLMVFWRLRETVAVIYRYSRGAVLEMRGQLLTLEEIHRMLVAEIRPDLSPAEQEERVVSLKQLFNIPRVTFAERLRRIWTVRSREQYKELDALRLNFDLDDED